VPLDESSVVILPRRAVPKFPDRCILCGCSHPGTTTFTTRDALKGRAFWAGWYSVELPACRRCGWRLLLSQVYNGLAILSLGVLAVSTFILVRSRAPTIVALLSLGVVDVFGIWFLVQWSRRHPARFAIEPRDDSVSFEFRDPAQALEFATANGARIEPPRGYAAGRLTSA
jgi:hypothetical protein